MTTEQPNNSFEEYIAEHVSEGKALVERFRSAQNVVALRQAWQESKIVGGLNGYMREKDYREITEGLMQGIAQLGIDLKSDDERVKQMIDGFSSRKPRDGGLYDLNEHDTGLTGVFRILSGSDPTVEQGISLLLPETTINKTIPSVQVFANRFAGESDYSIASNHPPMYRRTIRDPKSEYWGVSVYYDAFPGYGSENAAIFIPTGRISGDSLDTIGTPNGNSSYRSPSRENRYLMAQSVQIGRPSGFDTQVDTSSQFVQIFIDQNGGNKVDVSI